ncbi:MAG TPA: methyltransferase domain-containing protein [Ktedonobacteraceae bacterium]|nr:methyltransferase domain-containing protein [Ktedonobacteraceae bacterium]
MSYQPSSLDHNQHESEATKDNESYAPRCARLEIGNWPAQIPEGTLACELFENQFGMEDLLAFDDTLLAHIASGGYDQAIDKLAISLKGAPDELVRRFEAQIPANEQAKFAGVLQENVSDKDVEAARRHVLDRLFWELTYWKTPDLYEDLTEGECLHSEIFRQLEPDLRGKVALDAGAGTGRATFECLRYGAKLVYAAEPSPGLLCILNRKREQYPSPERITPVQARFEALPLPDGAIDLVISCSAFTANEEAGGERGLAEFRRVAKKGGKIVIIWPRAQDYGWLAAHGFHYVALPDVQEKGIHFRSVHRAIECARHFYARNPCVEQYIMREHTPDVPYEIIGMNPPRDYCWLVVE